MTRNSRARQPIGKGHGGRKALHVNDFETDHHNPFDEETPDNRWLLTTCVAGVAGSMVVAAAVLGFFGEQPAGNQALASVQPTEMFQRPSVTLKGDFATTVEQATELQPFKPVSVAYRPQAASTSSMTDSLLASASPVDDAASGNSSMYPDISANLLSYDAGSAADGNTAVLDGSFQINSFDTPNLTQVTKTPPPEPVDQDFTLESGDTLIDKLASLGVTREAARAMTAAMEPVYPGSLIKAGQTFTVTLDNQQDFYGNFVLTPVQLSFSPGEKEEIVIEADEDGNFVAYVNGEESEKRSRYARKADQPTQFRVSGKITSTLYAAAKDRGVPENVIAEMIRAFSYDVDFQRQVGAGDTFEVFFGPPLSGSSKKRKVMHYAKLNFGKATKTYYRFTDKDGRTAYYDENGKSASKFLVKTPISGARISSGYGLRRHPILGYTKMHAGVDFAVPRGTPIRAAGSGTLKLVGRKGAYGRAIVIDHGRGYETLYAHMHRYASGMRAGRRVRQGQVIGYVGSSGRATGPHLHYEVRVKGRTMNPSKVRVAGSQALSKSDMRTFKKHKTTVLALMKTAPTSTKLASAGN